MLDPVTIGLIVLARKVSKTLSEVRCRICRQKVAGEHKVTTCCGAPLCSNGCLQAWMVAGGKRCIYCNKAHA